MQVKRRETIEAHVLGSRMVRKGGGRATRRPLARYRSVTAAGRALRPRVPLTVGGVGSSDHAADRGNARTGRPPQAI